MTLLPLTGHKLEAYTAEAAHAGYGYTLEYYTYTATYYRCSCGKADFKRNTGNSAASDLAFINHCLAVLGAGREEQT